MTTSSPRLTSPDQILHEALKKEEQARDFYADLAADCTIEFVKTLLITLQNEESKHVRMIRDMLGKLASGRSLT